MYGLLNYKLTKKNKSLLVMVTWRWQVSTSSEGLAGFGDLMLIPILQMVILEQRAVQEVDQGCKTTES